MLTMIAKLIVRKIFEMVYAIGHIFKQFNDGQTSMSCKYITSYKSFATCTEHVNEPGIGERG